MIITKLNGGLGNQMFEYAHARSLQLRNHDKLALDIEGFTHSNPKYPVRHYSLNCFNIPDVVQIIPIENSKKLILAQAASKINRTIASKVFELFHIYLWKTPQYKEFNIGDTKKGIYYFYGYWQSDKYFRDYADLIRTELRVKANPIPEVLPYLEKADNRNSVCVHIRRGDYVQGNMITCDEKYYLSGMRYIAERVSDECTFLIFTDDIEWVKKNIHFEYPVEYVTIDNPDYEVLRIMYSCNHFVISNSSYSWWGQFLSDRAGKIVFAPNVWFPNMPEEKSIYQDNWVVYSEEL